jgi:tetratricopeptide (TPR) repeat protein
MNSEMKTLAQLADRFREPRQDRRQMIGVYRRHAVRAVAEERWAAAGIFLDRILEVDPRHTEAWLMKGHLYRHCLGNTEAALSCYRKVIVLGAYDTTHPHVRRAQQSLEQLLKRLA